MQRQGRDVSSGSFKYSIFQYSQNKFKWGLLKDKTKKEKKEKLHKARERDRIVKVFDIPTHKAVGVSKGYSYSFFFSDSHYITQANRKCSPLASAS